ncbi:Protein of unknown function [Devosia lucknowensis]|uniref:Nutrient deprivation-induced protein n=1 Tax=Devosia lucknowensis TaxID=1096929 RepID=A0A1Y6GDM6_9HYPH|nr:DUF3618 domain-containing protein [Devosia lucknowensis]SMQ86179.1 Protein of unknown function [Devosia lucknowensis]
MAYDSDNKSSAELQREIEQQRTRVESTIDQIQEKLSPGQLVDELLAYTKGGGGEFVASLQRNVTANPLPVALLGVSLAWLMAKPASATTADRDEASTIRSDRHWDDSINRRRGYQATTSADVDEYEDYPVTVISGTSLQRLGNSADERGDTYSEFTDDAGKKFRARSDKSGNRAGHFIDEAGNRFKGFTNDAGEQIEHFRDEAGNLLGEASGWASHTWQKAREKMHDARDAVQSQASSGKAKAGHASDALQGQMEHLNQTILNQFRDQPLVGGALAFALGAALGSTLPHTPQEDALVGEASDVLKGKVVETASELYDQGKDKAADLYSTATEKVGEVYQQAKDGVAAAAEPSGPARSDSSST